MAIQIGINGFGRIGRVAFRIAISQPETFHLCGINVRNADLNYMVYMIRYDSIFGRFQGELSVYDGGILVNGQKIPVFSESDAASIPWEACGAEYIIDATGAFCTTQKAMHTFMPVLRKLSSLLRQKTKRLQPLSWVSTRTNIHRTCKLSQTHLVQQTVWLQFVKSLKIIMGLNMV